MGKMINVWLERQRERGKREGDRTRVLKSWTFLSHPPRKDQWQTQETLISEDLELHQSARQRGRPLSQSPCHEQSSNSLGHPSSTETHQAAKKRIQNLTSNDIILVKIFFQLKLILVMHKSSPAHLISSGWFGVWPPLNVITNVRIILVPLQGDVPDRIADFLHSKEHCIIIGFFV